MATSSIKSGRYEGYTINTLNAEQKTFLLLRPGPSQIDVTDQASNGLLTIFRGCIGFDAIRFAG